MQLNSPLVILPAVTVFAQLFILDSQQKLSATIREGSVAVSLASGGPLFWWRLAKLFRTTVSNRPCSLGLLGLCSGCASPGPPFLPASPWGNLLFDTVTQHQVRWEAFSVPPLKSQVSICIHSFVPSFIHSFISPVCYYLPSPQQVARLCCVLGIPRQLEHISCAYLYPTARVYSLKCLRHTVGTA